MSRKVIVTITEPRPWWRRLLRLPARSSRRGPFELVPWPGALQGHRAATPRPSPTTRGEPGMTDQPDMAQMLHKSFGDGQQLTQFLADERTEQRRRFMVLTGPNGECGCCLTTGEHPCGSECGSCDGSGRQPDAPICTLPHGADCRCTSA